MKTRPRLIVGDLLTALSIPLFRRVATMFHV